MVLAEVPVVRTQVELAEVEGTETRSYKTEYNQATHSNF